MNMQFKTNAVRYRALRAMVAGLLNSSLSDGDLKKVARELDLDFLSSLKDVLTSFPFENNSDYDVGDGFASENSELADQILDLIKIRKITKINLQNYIYDIDTKIAGKLDLSRLTMRRMVEEFVAVAGRERANALRSRVLGEVDQDPYLLGISARK